MTDTEKLARDLAFVAGDLDQRGYPFAGTIRQAARALLDVPEPAGQGCKACGADLPAGRTGRPRIWCSDKCRRAHRP